MGKGGQRAAEPIKRNASLDRSFDSSATAASSLSSSTGASTVDHVWKSPYNPLDPAAPALPSRGAIKAVIPEACFRRSYVWSMIYTIRDLVTAAAFVYGTSQVLSTDLPDLANPVAVATWVAGWSFYAFWMGTIMTGPWVVAHECGHGAYSDSQTWNDIVGFILHQALLVPYFAWQYTHAKHHRRTNHLVDGESHVPPSALDNGLGPNLERNAFYAVFHEAMGDGVFAVFQIWSHLFLGWPLYLFGLASTGKLAHDGTPLNDAIADHFRPWSPMFPSKMSWKIWLSTTTCLATLAGLIYAGHALGHVKVLLWYWGPYFFVNAWLVLYTWLQHTDPSIPHYDDSNWTWVKGALSTIDRPYGIFDYFHHTIGSTHVVHHLFHEMPWYNAGVATKHVKAYLEPMGLYNYDPTPWYLAMWRIARTCHYVDEHAGIQYFKSLENVPRSRKSKQS
jgi:fatty acid desaturase